MKNLVIIWLLVAFYKLVQSSLIKLTVHQESNEGLTHEVLIGILEHPFCETERKFIERCLQNWTRKYITTRFGLSQFPLLQAVRIGDDQRSLEGGILGLSSYLKDKLQIFLERQTNDKLIAAFTKCSFYERPRIIDDSLPLEMNLLIGEIIIESYHKDTVESKNDEEFELATRELVPIVETSISIL